MPQHMAAVANSVYPTSVRSTTHVAAEFPNIEGYSTITVSLVAWARAASSGVHAPRRRVRAPTHAPVCQGEMTLSQLGVNG
jgi:hypothetical protein